MAHFRYTCKRSALQNHIIDQQYELEIGATSAPKSRIVERTDVRAAGGATESLYHRADREWSVTLQPVNGDRMDELTEFLESTESGEAFEMRIYGTESSFTTVKRTDKGHQWQEFLMVGSERDDWFQTSISVRAV